MGRAKKTVLILLCCVVGVIAALAIWNLSPGPAWMAEQTARRYLERNVPEYDIVQVMEENTSRNIMLFYLPPLGVQYHSYLAVGMLDEDNDEQCIRMELDWGPFPLKVAEAAEFNSKDGTRKIVEP